jgi:hypothetical protein
MSWLAGHNLIEDDHLSPEEKSEKEYIIKAEEAIKRRTEKRDELYVKIREAETEERESDGIADHEFRCHLWKISGDIPKVKIWYRQPASYTDDTTRCNFWCWEEDLDIDEDWYVQGPEYFNKTVKLLNPRALERQYGKVFFGTETKYISKDKIVPSSLKQEVKGYYLDGENKVYDEFKRQPRSDLYYPPKTGVTTYGSEKFNYRHTGTGILKVLNCEGRRYHYFKQRNQTIKRSILTLHPSPDPNQPNGQLSVGAALFAELRKHHFDFEYWAHIDYRPVQTTDEEYRSYLQKTDAESYQFHSRKAGKAINRIVLKRIKNSNLVRRVQRKWRSDWRKTSKRAVLASRCQRAWRRHVLRSFGTKRTIVGLLGKNIKFDFEYKPFRTVDRTAVCASIVLFLIYIKEYF